MASKLMKMTSQFGPPAARALGTSGFARFVGTTLRHFPEVVRSRYLKPVDRSIGGEVSLRYRGETLVFPVGEIDDLVVEDSFCFGLMREIYFSDCYMALQKARPPFEVAIDLGSNRGIFSAYLGRVSDRLIVVEANPKYDEARARLLRRNGVTSYDVLHGFVGIDAADAAFGADVPVEQRIDLVAELHRLGIARVSFAKIDIEGGEFGLVNRPEFLAMLDAFSMEVHDVGCDRHALIEQLKDAGFRLAGATVNFTPTSDVAQAQYLSGWKSSSGTA